MNHYFMRNLMRNLMRNVLCITMALIMAPAWSQSDCQRAEVAVQILGSGGPNVDDARAGSSALVWVGGEARVLVDVGGGAFLRFGQSGARIEDLDLIALTHFHADHVADLPAILQSASFTDRSRKLMFSGPSGGGGFPGLDELMHQLFDTDSGAFRYLADPGFSLTQQTVAENIRRAIEVLDQSDLRVDAIGVPHGTVPALAYRIRARDQVIVFSGDQNGLEDHFWQFAENADVLVMNHVIAEDAGQRALSRHAPPSVIGRGAASARVGQLLLSHRMQRSGPPAQARQIIGESFAGDITFAEDLMCLPLK